MANVAPLSNKAAAKPIRADLVMIFSGPICPTEKTTTGAACSQQGRFPPSWSVDHSPKQLADDVGPRWADVHLCGFSATCVAKPPRS
jgi:hypothetical protein